MQKAHLPGAPSDDKPVSRRGYWIAFMLGALPAAAAPGYAWWYFSSAGPAAHSMDRGEALGYWYLLLAFPTSIVTSGIAELLPHNRLGIALMLALFVGGVPLNWGLIALGCYALVASSNRAPPKEASPSAD